jgi:hypothetical protein
MIVVPYPIKPGMGKASYLFWLGNIVVVHVTEYVANPYSNDRYSREQNRVFAFDRTTGKKRTVHQSWNIKGVEFVTTKPENEVAMLDLSTYTLRKLAPEWLNSPRYTLPVFHSEIHKADDVDTSPHATTANVKTTITHNTDEHDTVTVNTRTLDLGETYLRATAVHPDETTVAVAGNNCLYLIDVD